MPTDGSDATTPLDTSTEVALADKDYNVRREAIRSLYLSAEEESDVVAREQQHQEVFNLMNEYSAPCEVISVGGWKVQSLIKGFVPNDTRLPKGLGGGKGDIELIVDTGDMWEPFKDFCNCVRERTHNPGVEISKAGGIGTEEQAVVKAAQETVLNYFGIPNSKTAGENSHIYNGDTPKLSSFKGNSTAVCTEMGVLAHNLFNFAGVDSTLVMGGTLSRWDKEDNLIGESAEGHVFIIFRSLDKSRTYLFDPSNTDSLEYGGKTYKFPYVRSLDQQAIEDLFVKKKSVCFDEGDISREYWIN